MQKNHDQQQTRVTVTHSILLNPQTVVAVVAYTHTLTHTEPSSGGGFPLTFATWMLSIRYYCQVKEWIPATVSCCYMLVQRGWLQHQILYDHTGCPQITDRLNKGNMTSILNLSSNFDWIDYVCIWTDSVYHLKHLQKRFVVNWNNLNKLHWIKMLLNFTA